MQIPPRLRSEDNVRLIYELFVQGITAIDDAKVTTSAPLRSLARYYHRCSNEWALTLSNPKNVDSDRG